MPDDSTPEQIDVAPADNEAPTPVLTGTFALYLDGKGGWVIVGETPVHGVVRKHISPSLMRMMKPIIGRFGEL